MQEKMRSEKIQKDVNTGIEYIILLSDCGILSHSMTIWSNIISY